MDNKALALIIRGYAVELLQVIAEVNEECLTYDMPEHVTLEPIELPKNFFALDFRSVKEKLETGTHKAVKTGRVIALDPLRDFIEKMDEDIKRLNGTD